MLKLETLGGLVVKGPDGKPLLVQRRRLAVLVRLSFAGERGMTREKLSASLWGESSQERARHALEQSVYSLRRQLSAEVLLGGDPLRLNPAVVSSDVEAFERAIATGAFAEAVRLYSGDFLDGVFIEDAEDFGQWAEGERQRLRREYLSALEAVARSSDDRGDLAAATQSWRAHVAADPLSEVAVAGLVRSLAVAGNSSAALQAAQEFEQRIAVELQGLPGPMLTALVQDVRAGRVRPASPKPPPAEPFRAAAAPGPAAGETTRTDAVTSAGRPSWRRVLMVGAGLAVVLLAISVWRGLGRSRTPSPLRAAPDRIAVLPPRIIGTDSSIQSFAESVTDLLAIALDGDGVPAAVDPAATLAAWTRVKLAGTASVDAARTVARAVGASTALVTDAAPNGPGSVRVTARILSTDDGAMRAKAEFSGGVASPLAVVRQLLPELLSRQAGEEEQRLVSLSTASLPAVVEFLRGRAERRRGHVDAALQHFSRALSHDSTFALAALEFASTSGWLLRWTAQGGDTVVQTFGLGFWSIAPRTARDDERWNEAMHVAVRERHRLSARDRALLNALTGPHFPGASYAREMLRAWDDVLRAAPDRADAYYSLGCLLLFQGDAMGLADARERAKAAFNRSLELDSAFVGPLVGLLEIASFDRAIADVRRIGVLYLSRDSLGAQADYVRWRIASVTDDERALVRLRSRFDALDASTLARIEKMSQIDGIGIDDGDRAAETGLRRSGERNARQIAFHSAFFLALNRGRPRAALDILDRKRDVDLNDNLGHAFRLRGALFGDGDQEAGASSVRVFTECVRGLPPTASVRDSRCAPNATFSVTLWRLWRDDTTGAAGVIDKMRGSRADAPNPQADLLNALLTGIIRRRDAPAALARLDSLSQLGCCGTPHFINLVVARLHERSGNYPAALAAVRRGRWLFPPEYLATYLREEGRLATLTGDRDGAAAAYRHYLVLRAAPESSLQSQRDSVAIALANLARGG